MNAGYRVSLSHANRMAVKTDAPNDFVWRMMRAIKDKNTCEGRKEHKGTGMATLTQCCNLKKLGLAIRRQLGCSWGQFLDYFDTSLTRGNQ